MKCNHSFVLIQKSPFERVKHCIKCHTEIGENEKVKAPEKKEGKTDAE